MKKSLTLLVAVFLSVAAYSQAYVKPVLVSESSPGACDGKLSMIPYNTAPPYELRWYPISNGQGFYIENVCSDTRYEMSMIDKYCREYGFLIKPHPDPAEQPRLDTIIMTYPTSGNNGKLEFHFQNVPAGVTRRFFRPTSGGITNDSIFTGLGPGAYEYVISLGSNGSTFYYSIRVSLYTSLTSCNPHYADIETQLAFNTAPYTNCTYPPPGSGTACDGSFTVFSNSVLGDEVGITVYHDFGLGISSGLYNEDLVSFVDSICSGVYHIHTMGPILTGPYFYRTTRYVYLPDTLDQVYVWNEAAGIDVTNADIVVLNSNNLPSIDYGLPIDTVYIDSMQLLADNQYLLRTAIVQAADTSWFYYLPFLDCSHDCIFDVSFFEYDSMACGVPSAVRNIICWEWPPSIDCPGDTLVVSENPLYLKPIVTSESVPGACDASVTVIPYGGTPPYSIEWMDGGTWHPSMGLTAENLCSGEEISIKLIDANCNHFEASLKIAADPYDQVSLDTIYITYPTPNEPNGSFRAFFNNIPGGAERTWSFPGGSGITNEILKNQLREGMYGYGIKDDASDMFMSISIPMFSGTHSPCDPFVSSMEVSPFASFLARSPSCEETFPPPPPPYGSGQEPDFVCNGSFAVFSSDAAVGDYYDTAYYKNSGVPVFMYVDKSTNATETVACRGPYTIYSHTFPYITNLYYNVNSVFVSDSLDTYYLWNIPDTIPPETDTLLLDALNRPAINYGDTVDTAYIHHVHLIGAGQYEIVTAIQQGPDYYYLHSTDFLNTAMNYVFDITVFEGDSLLCDVNNMQRHIIYWQWPEEPEPCDSLVICHVSPGNPTNAHTITVPCEDVDDHIGNHPNDYLGPCYSSAAAQNETPTDYEHGHNQKAVNVKQHTLYLFPNPFNENIQLRSSVTIQRVEIISLDGKPVLSQVINSTSAVLNTDHLLPSAYFIKLYIEDHPAEMRKLVKIK